MLAAVATGTQFARSEIPSLNQFWAILLLVVIVCSLYVYSRVIHHGLKRQLLPIDVTVSCTWPLAAVDKVTLYKLLHIGVHCCNS